jgi:hypothetical protein
VKDVKFLGHRVDARGVQPLVEKVKEVQDFPRPSSQKQLCTFLGMMNFYHRFIPNAAALLQPLHDLANRKLPPGPLQWIPDDLLAFERTRGLLSSAATLPHPLPDAAVLKAAEKKYSTFDRELLAAFLATRHFHHY